MGREYAIFMAIICILILLIGVYLFRGSSDGFFDYAAQREYNDRIHNEYVETNKMRYNSLGMALVSVGNQGAIGTDTKPIVGTGEKILKPDTSEYTQDIDNKYPLEDGKSGMFAIIEKCEAIKSTDCSAFDDPGFQLNCGMCLDIGENSQRQPATGGLVLLPEDKKFADKAKVGNFIPNYLPTLGSCPANKMVSTKAQCLRLKKELECTKNASYDLPGCSQCYADGTYFPVDSTTSKYGASIKLIGDGGALYFAENGIWLVAGDKALSDTPITVTLSGNENSRFYIYIASDETSRSKASIGGYLVGDTANGEMTLDLARLVIVDSATQRKPTTMGVRQLDGIDIRMMKVKPASQFPFRWVGRDRAVIYGPWADHALVGTIPFTFIDTSSQEASRCQAGPYVTTPEAASFLDSDPCYKKGSGPGNYNMECLQNTMDANGCFREGKGYPIDAATAANLMSKGRTINDIANYIYEQAVITATGVNASGQKLSIKDVSASSVFCTGKDITSPCDIGNKDSGPLSVDCLNYLWKNMGSGNSNGSTYWAASQASGLFKTGSTPRFCQSSGTLAPVSDDGKPNSKNIAYWQSKGGFNAVRNLMRDIHETANSEMQDNDKAEAILQCYGTELAMRPKPSGNVNNPDVCQYPKGSDVRGLCGTGAFERSGLVLWLDGKDPLGDGRAPSEGLAISKWIDKSGNNNDATAVGTVPVFSNNGIKFNNNAGNTAASQYYSSPLTSRAALETIFVVYSTTNSNIQQSLVDTNRPGGRQFQHLAANGPSLAQNTIAWLQTPRTAIQSNTKILTTLSYDMSSKINIYVSGNIVGSSRFPTQYSFNAGTTLIGAGVFGSPIVWGFSGTIYDVIVFNRVLPDSEREKVEDYLTNKWKL